jgi:methylase of polypeptide subunit release factors
MSKIRWNEDETQGSTARSARWQSESGTPPPDRLVVVDDRTKADTAYRLACEGTALLWRGDFHNGRQLLQAMARRIDRKPPRTSDAGSPAEAFHLHRQARSHRARVLGRLLVLLEDGYSLGLRRAPDVRQACTEAYGPQAEPTVVALTELLGVIGAHEWRKKGVPIPNIGARIHPHYGVFSPLRGEYVDLVAQAPLPARRRVAYDVGTGTGVLAAVLAHRGFERVVATDDSPRALACARDNAHRLGLAERIEVVGPCLYPDGPDGLDGRADLVVSNPPWIPARPTSELDHGVYDEGGGMLLGFLAGLAGHLAPEGEGWLVHSDLAERLGLREPGELRAAIDAAGLEVVDKTDTRPRHPRARDATDPLHAARAAEVVSLWRLRA